MSFSSEIESSATEMELLDSSSSLSPMSGSCTESNPLVDTEDETGTLSSCSVDLSSTEFELLDSDLELLGSSDHDENSFGDGAATDEPFILGDEFEDTPLYAGATVTKFQALIQIMQFALR